MGKQVLIIIRGLPGSGKSTLAKSICQEFYPYTLHYETDMYFTNEKGEYNFVGELIGEAHDWCQSKVEEALENGVDVVVSNTFTRIKEMQPYLNMAKRFGIEPTIIEAKGNFKSIHNVPDRVLENMRNRWEEYDCGS